ncbi:MAG: four helix bundle protein [Thermomicrobiales bacterium]
MTVRSFRDLFAWQRAMDLAAGIYEVTRTWPREEIYGLTGQARRAAVSVMANIAEGKGRSGSREFLHHLSIADGSLAEVESHLLLAHKIKFLDEATLEPLLHQIEETRSLVRGLIRSLR